MAEKKPAQLMSIKDGNEEKLHIRTTSSVVSLNRTNPKLPENIYDIQALANALGKLAFLDDTVDPPEPEPEPPLPCKNLKAVATQTAIQLTWEDPDDDTWASTRIVRKTGGYPTSETDGTTVTTTSIKNQYQSSPFVDDGLSSGVTYYYRAFSCSSNGIFNTEDQVTASAMVPNTDITVMSVVLDLSIQYPNFCGSYTDDALGMPYGKTEEAISAWQEFFKYKPCLLKNGQVVGYLNPNDYTKFENGDPADITSGDAGDVMIEFPRRGLRISKVDKKITISMTDAQDDPNFTYYAHTRGTEGKDAFYLSAYMASDRDGVLRSLSGETFSHTKNTTDFRTSAHLHGYGYEMYTFYQYTYIQAMYCLQFQGRLNSQQEVGNGYEIAAAKEAISGSLNTKGLIYGSSSSTEDIKLFGLETVFGQFYSELDGIRFISKYNGNVVAVATDQFNYNADGYTEYDAVVSGSGPINDVAGTSELGFLPTDRYGSTSTYFCDYCSITYTGASTIDIIISNGYISVGMPNCGLFAIVSSVLGPDDKEHPSAKVHLTRLSYY